MGASYDTPSQINSTVELNTASVGLFTSTSTSVLTSRTVKLSSRTLRSVPIASVSIQAGTPGSGSGSVANSVSIFLHFIQLLPSCYYLELMNPFLDQADIVDTCGLLWRSDGVSLNGDMKWAPWVHI